MIYIYSLPLKLPSCLQIVTESQAGLCVLYTNSPLSVLHVIVYICQCYFVDIFKRWNSILEFSQENIFLYGGLVSKSCLNLVTTWTVACQSFVHKLSQARILEWVTFSFSRGSSLSRDQTQVSCILGGFFTN